MINKFNAWYDNIREPYRFLLAMALVAVGAVIFHSGHVKSGIICMTILLLVRMRGKYAAL